MPPEELVDFLFFLYEFQNQRFTAEVLGSLSALNLSRVRMTPLKCFVLAAVLACTPPRHVLESLDLSSCSLTCESLDTLRPVLLRCKTVKKFTFNPKVGIDNPALVTTDDTEMGCSPVPRLCRLCRSEGESFGFYLRMELGCAGHVIRQVEPWSVAERSGLRDGDRLLEINGDFVDHMEHSKIVQKIHASGMQVSFLVLEGSDFERARGQGVDLRALAREHSGGEQCARPRLCHVTRDHQDGLGFTIAAVEGSKGRFSLTVTSGGPAEKAGVRTGDRLIWINGDHVADLTHCALNKMLGLTPLLFSEDSDPVTPLQEETPALTAPPVENLQEPRAPLAKPRLCHLEKGNAGFGFNLLSILDEPSMFIGQVAQGSPAERADLREGDVVVEVNGVNVESEYIEDVVGRMKEGGSQLTVLVLGPGEYQQYKQSGTPITADLAVSKQTPGSVCSCSPSEMTDQGNNNNQNLSRNPFAALFSSVSDAKDFASVQKQLQPLSLDDSRGSQDDSDNSVSESVDENDDSLAEISRSFRSRQELCEQLNINHMIQRIFLLTLDNSDPSLKGGNGIPPRCVYLEEMASDLDGQDWLDMDNIEQAVFNRMLMPEPGNHLINMTSSSALNLSADRDAGEKRAVPYLFSCFQRAKEEIKKVPEKLLACAVRCKNLSVLNARTVLLTPEIYVGQNVSEQLLNLLLEACNTVPSLPVTVLEEVGEFLDEVIAALLADQEVRTFGEVMVPVLEVMLGRVKDLDLCQLLLSSYLDILVYFSKQLDIAKVFLDYIQPKDPNNGLQYQKTLLGAVLNISCLLKTPGVVESHGYFLNPSRSSPQETKVQESNIHQMYASDAFFLNLGAALLRLCQPFCRLRSPKLLTFNPTYCALKELNEEERRSRNVHVKGLDKETTLIPAPQNQEPEFAQSYNLLTENLILTQYTLHLGFHRLHDQMVKMNQSLHRLQGVWREAQQSASPASEQLREQFERLMTVYLSTKAAATEPHMLQGCLNLQVSTATVLVQFSLGASGVDYPQLTFPLPALKSSPLCYVPEFFADSLGDFFIFLRRFADEVLESSGASLEQILDFVTVFMGNVDRLKNPHLRAKLAEVLEAVMPHLEQVPGPAQSSMFQRERAFCTYQHAAQLAEALITVFVDIEFTGDPHQFEQKFNYRRPMYPILKYMWGKDSYRESIKSLARYASENLETMNPPLFLRFLNLLMNDAIFLLDEAIQYLSKIKVLQIERDRGEWDSLAPDARREKESSLQMFGQLARFHNIMSNETIGTLAFLTSEIKCLFAHPFLAERIISMLNYFLQHLVGPKMGALKVKDFTEFDFKPQQLVSDICTISLNLGNEENFCSTVPKDGRSYSPRLFAQMVRVLKKINKPGNMIVSFSQLADKIKSLADQQLQDEETYADAPDEFLDPIMSTLMLDPVLLPSSRVTVDRSTIARHLLSDQTDPFSRSPLTMDQIRSNTELKERIQQWLAERKQKRLQTGQSA
ncbi:UNVERIFIED_CONTAM: hypothetical protein FKN15_021545 [Acipenser sinensis]